MASKKDFNYYDMFVQMSEYSRLSAEMLYKILTSFSTDNLEHQLVEMHTMEHDADVCKHEMMSRLGREFITPIEREDIMEIAQELDEVTDSIEDVLQRIFMYNIKSIPPEALEFTEVIVNCCDGMKTVLEEFHNFRKSTTIQGSIIEINRLEEVGDKLYSTAMRKLYGTCDNAVQILAWTQTFDCLEKCCDACEHVANLVESVIMKNS